MLFMISYKFRPEARNKTHARFGRIGQECAPAAAGSPVEGVKLVGRWHGLGGSRGFLLAESNDAVAIGKMLQNWTDLVQFNVMPVYDDEGAAQVLDIGRRTTDQPIDLTVSLQSDKASIVATLEQIVRNLK